MSTQPETAPQQTPTDPPAAPQAPQNPPPNPPQAPPQNPPQNPPSDQQARRDASDATRNLLDSRSLQDLRTEIQALPERMVHAYREAFQAPQQPANSGGGSGNGGTPTAGAGSPPATPGKRKGFADWWFNG